jgi:putative ABC transport system permease protein
MKIPFKYIIRNLKVRKLTTGITIFGIALVVFVFSAVLMMSYGVEKTLVSTGNDDNVIITRKASYGEISSIIDPETQAVIKSLPYIAKNKEGIQILSAEPVVIINLPKGEGLSNLMVRGVNNTVFTLRDNIKIIEGRKFREGVREIIVGEGVRRTFTGANIGDKVKFAGDNWKIVGVFSANGSGFDSELWGDAQQLLSAFNRGNTVSSLTLKLQSKDDFTKFTNLFKTDKRLQYYEPKVETKYFAEQSEMLAGFIKILGTFITIIFSFGSIIGASITMYAAVANRTIEIGTLRSLGFRRRSVLTAFLTESLAISIIGGITGLVIASLLQFITISTLNFSSFAELQFSFALSSDIIISSMIFAVIMGLLGGFFPAVRASRLKIVDALRA